MSYLQVAQGKKIISQVRRVIQPGQKGREKTPESRNSVRRQEKCWDFQIILICIKIVVWTFGEYSSGVIQLGEPEALKQRSSFNYGYNIYKRSDNSGSHAFIYRVL